MVSKKPIDGGHEPETELRPDSAEHPGLAGNTSGIKPILAQRMSDSERERLKVAHRGPHMAGARQETIRCRLAEDFGNNTIRYHQMSSRLSDSSATEAVEPVSAHRLYVVRDNQDT